MEHVFLEQQQQVEEEQTQQQDKATRISRGMQEDTIMAPLVNAKCFL